MIPGLPPGAVQIVPELGDAVEVRLAGDVLDDEVANLPDAGPQLARCQRSVTTLVVAAELLPRDAGLTPDEQHDLDHEILSETQRGTRGGKPRVPLPSR
jgi:hypothetical protein